VLDEIFSAEHLAAHRPIQCGETEAAETTAIPESVSEEDAQILGAMKALGYLD
jgi:hypothetical protein